MSLFPSGKGVNLLKGLDLFFVRPSQSTSNCTKRPPNVQRICHKVEKDFPPILQSEAGLPSNFRQGGNYGGVRLAGGSLSGSPNWSKRGLNLDNCYWVSAKQPELKAGCSVDEFHMNTLARSGCQKPTNWVFLPWLI